MISLSRHVTAQGKWLGTLHRNDRLLFPDHLNTLNPLNWTVPNIYTFSRFCFFFLSFVHTHYIQMFTLIGHFQKISLVVARTDKPLVFILGECEPVIQS